MNDIEKTNKQKNKKTGKINDIYEVFIRDISQILNFHPFKKIIYRNTISALLPHFLAMSTAFPYIQAGSQLPLILDLMERDQDVSHAHEILAVVGSFLCWDETGGGHVLECFGKAGLSKILQTKKWSHTNILKQDVNLITGLHIKPDFSEPTYSYLKLLIQGFSDLNPVIRCAHMVAFECHADVIIQNLWQVICDNFDVNPDKLTYFKIHVGSDDPAEAYHVAMTKEMIKHIVSPNDEILFLTTAKESIKIHLDWAEKLAEFR